MLPDITLGLSKQRNTCTGRDIPSEVFGSFKGELYCSLSDSAATLNCALDDSHILKGSGFCYQNWEKFGLMGWILIRNYRRNFQFSHNLMERNVCGWSILLYLLKQVGSYEYWFVCL